MKVTVAAFFCLCSCNHLLVLLIIRPAPSLRKCPPVWHIMLRVTKCWGEVKEGMSDNSLNPQEVACSAFWTIQKHACVHFWSGFQKQKSQNCHVLKNFITHAPFYDHVIMFCLYDILMLRFWNNRSSRTVFIDQINSVKVLYFKFF